MPPSVPPDRTKITLTDWLHALPHLKKRGGESVGPCPLCGGENRFRVGPRGAFCRQCLPDGSNPERLRELQDVVFGKQPTGGHWADALGPRARPKPQTAAPDEEASLPADLWRACIDATGTLAHLYLQRRYVWPPPGSEFPPVPTTIGWLDAAAVKGWRRKGWPGLPADAAGALVCRYDRPDLQAAAVSLEGLTADGVRVPYTDRHGKREHRWRRTFGTRQGTHFAAWHATSGKALVVCEGELTALACHWMAIWATVWALGGAGALAHFAPPAGYLGTRAVLDGDEAGVKLRPNLAARGIDVQISPPGQDAADQWTETYQERADLFQADGLTRRAAELATWKLAMNGGL